MHLAACGTDASGFLPFFQVPHATAADGAQVPGYFFGPTGAVSRSQHQRSWSTQAACSSDSRGRECRCDFSGGCALGNAAVQLSFAPPTDSSRRWARGAKFGRRFSFEVRRCNFIVTVLHNSSGETGEPGMTVVGNRWLTAGCWGGQR